jgi:xyloglucan-specific exo-beta-1,4-glucanase
MIMNATNVRSISSFVPMLKFLFLFICMAGLHLPADAQTRRDRNERTIRQDFRKPHVKQGFEVALTEIRGPEYGHVGSFVFDPQRENVLYASNMGRQIFRSEDGGETWEHLYSSPWMFQLESEIRHMRFANPAEPTHLYFIVSNQAAYDVDFRGLYILDVSTGEIVDIIKVFWVEYAEHLNLIEYDVDPENADNIVVVSHMRTSFPGPKRSAWRSTNGGESLELIYDVDSFDQQNAKVVRICPGSPDTLVMGMVGSPIEQGGGFYRTTDGGESWSRTDNGYYINDIDFVPGNPEQVFAISGRYNTVPVVFFSGDGGQTWTEREINIGQDITLLGYFNSFDFDPGNPQSMWITHERGILSSHDGGFNWEYFYFDNSVYNTYNYGYTLAVNPFDSKNVVAGSDKRSVQTYDKGESWELMSLPMMQIIDIDAVRYPDGDTYLYYTSNGSYFAENLETRERNESFNPHMANETYIIFGDAYTQDRAFVSKRSGFIGGITLYQSDDNFATPPKAVYTDFGANAVSDIVRDPNDPDTYWFILFNPFMGDVLMRTRDGFETVEDLWVTGEDFEFINGIEVVEDQEGVIWVFAFGMESEAMFKSTDYGDTWTAYAEGFPEYPEVWSFAVNQNNPDNIIAAVGWDEGIYMTNNGGETWVPSFTEFECTHIRFSKNHEDVAFAFSETHQALLYTEDGGRSWLEVPDEVLLDITYINMDIVDQEESIDIFLTSEGGGIVRYAYAKPRYTVSFEINCNSGANITDATIRFGETTYEAGVYVVEDLEPDTYTYTVSKAGYHDKSGEVSVSDKNEMISVMLEQDTTLAKDEKADMIRVFPNPASERVYIDLSGTMADVVEVSLVNTTGQIVRSKQFSGHVIAELSLSGLLPGIYYLRVISEGHCVKPLIIK